MNSCQNYGFKKDDCILGNLGLYTTKDPQAGDWYACVCKADNRALPSTCREVGNQIPTNESVDRIRTSLS